MIMIMSGAVRALTGGGHAGEGDRVARGWRDTLTFDKGTDAEYTFVTKHGEPLRSMKAVANALFVRKVALLGFWEFFDFRENEPWPDHWHGSPSTSPSVAAVAGKKSKPAKTKRNKKRQDAKVAQPRRSKRPRKQVKHSNSSTCAIANDAEDLSLSEDSDLS